MVKTKFKRAVSLVMAAVLSLGVFTNIGTTAYAASGTKSDVYIMELPRSGDTNNNGKWGHGELKFMNGWYSHAISTDSLRAMGSYSGNIAYCIEPGTGQHTEIHLPRKTRTISIISALTVQFQEMIFDLISVVFCSTDIAAASAQVGSRRTAMTQINFHTQSQHSSLFGKPLSAKEMKVLIISRPAVMMLFSTIFKRVIPFIAVLWLTITVCRKAYRSTQKCRVSVLSQAALQR